MKTNRLLYILLALSIINSCKTEEKPKVEEEIAQVREWKPEDTRSITGVMAKRGLIHKTDATTPGYILFQPSQSLHTYLMDKDGHIVHSWTGDLNSMHSYLTEEGHLFRLERDIDFPVFAAGGQAGRIREYDWDGNLLWDFKYANENELTHHDFELMPNGNILAIAYEVKSPEEAIAAGRNPEHVAKAGLWPDKVIEIKPVRPSGGEIVWEWYMWDHLIQDIDSTKNNYGDVAANPRKININVHGEEGPPMSEEQVEELKKAGVLTSNATADNQSSDLTHTNAIAYNEELDQIALSVPGFSEIFIIDHSTTTEEARGSTGGKWGHGGDLLYRWGNPMNYGRGNKEDRVLYFQHDVKWISKGNPGEGNLMVFNNDIVNPNNKIPSVWAAVMSAESADPQIAVGDLGNHSAIYELAPPVDEQGNYVLSETDPFGPDEMVWTYEAPDKYSFYSAFVSGAHRLSNGNTLITSGAKGRFFEVTADKQIVWEYWNPYNDHYRLPDGSPSQPGGPFMFYQFRATHFDADFPAFEGKNLTALEQQPEAFVFTPPPAPKDSVQ